MTLTPEVRAALALQARGLSPAAIERVLPLVGVQVLDGDAEVTARVDALAADLPSLFGATAAPGRPASPLATDGRTAREKAAERWDAMYPNRPRSKRPPTHQERLEERLAAARGRTGGDAA